MKKKSFFAIFFLFQVVFFAFSDEKNLSAELISAYNSGFYPDVVRIARKITKTETNSFEIFRATVYEGESLFHLGRISDSISVLEDQFFSFDSDYPNELAFLNSARLFWLGRSYFSSGILGKAQKCFFSSASTFKSLEESALKFSENPRDYYLLSILFGAKCYFSAQDYKNALPLFEFVISNGKKFSSEDYSECSIKLAQCYNFLGGEENAKKCVNLADNLQNAPFNSETKKSLFNEKGNALEILGNYEEAQKTYILAGSLSVWISVYEAEKTFQNSPDKKSGSLDSLKILEKAKKTQKKLKNKNPVLDETISLLSAKYNGILRNWKECEKFAEICRKSKNQNVQKNGIYWLALSKYETGDEKGATEIIENSQRLLTSARELSVPLIITEQYPKGIGSTIPELKNLIPQDSSIISKLTFSCCDTPESQRQDH